MRAAASLTLLIALGCSDVRVEDDSSAPSGGAAGAGGSESQTSSSTASGFGGSGGPSSDGGGGAGGEAPACGDGALDAGEECDDGNASAGDGCSSDCIVECEPFDVNDPHEAVWKHPLTHHCYRWAGGLAPDFCGVAMFAMAEADCVSWGSHLAALSTFEELDAVVASGLVVDFALDVFLGGQDMSGQGDWVWLNGEPWIYAPNVAPWNASEPTGGTFLEIYSDGAFNADVDGSACGWVCERTPTVPQ